MADLRASEPPTGPGAEPPRGRNGAAPTTTAPRALVIKGLVRSYKSGDRMLDVLRGVDLSLAAGEIVGLIGPSGSGKSSLLHAAGLLERPDEGEVWIDGRDCLKLSDNARTAVRRAKIGFVYQAHHLLPEFTALDNVALPRLISGDGPKRARAEAERLLTMLGLAERLEHRPATLSGGEQQRVAVARAVANHPRVVLADEPTGNLDPRTSSSVFTALLDLVRNEGVAALIATHNMELAGYMDRVMSLKDGRLVETGGGP
jgi:lipoprotein-releasing system ATP-binding protein